MKWKAQFNVAIGKCHLANWAFLLEVEQDQKNLIYGNKYKSDLTIANYHWDENIVIFFLPTSSLLK